ncbi:acyl carrier protein [Streptosporangium becharense]|uniref:Acyl carrier protein n=1 Tax=Streptosporangium becharense TaxID=1816182 RepID=A0A7W9ILJ9_9ACTN|nr:acyl carrier protein [Streptosporangium becharense]MBB5822975.1 acyl carrier protein [Streptosporangium becharense]
MAPEQVTPEADLFDDLHATSLIRVELLMALEEAFDIKVPDEEVADVRTIGDVHRLVVKLS